MNAPQSLQAIDRDEWFHYRHKARTNLQWLCTNVLDYKDVSTEIEPHAEMLSALQRFFGGTETDAKDISLDALRKGYKPNVPMWDLPNESPQRRTLILASRKFLKSSICTMGHKIQWNINYPNIRIVISSGTGNQVTKFGSGILQHYRFNDKFRWLFPEFVPWGKVDKFGAPSTGFTCLARTEILGDPTFAMTSVGSAVAGGHCEVICHDDVVNEENINTPDAIVRINTHIQMVSPLLMTYFGKPGWTDFVGTRYDFKDAYGLILDAEKALPKAERTYIFVFQPAWKGDWGTESCKAVWPERMPIEALKAIETDPLQGPYVLASQYGLKPRPPQSGLIENINEIVWDSRASLNELYPSLRLHVTLDLHGMAPVTAQNKHADNDYTAVTLAGFRDDGHCHVLSVWHGRPNPLEVINYLFYLWHIHPRIIDFKGQKDHIFRTLMPFLMREQTRLQRFLPIVGIPISNQVSKKNKIRALVPWFRTGTISFAEDIPCRFHLEEEIIRFPRFHDDILDTLRDQMENREGGTVTDVNFQPQILSPGSPAMLPGSDPKFLGYGENGVELWRGLPSPGDEEYPFGIDPMTGI
jgi:hypothetical protein